MEQHYCWLLRFDLFSHPFDPAASPSPRVTDASMRASPLISHLLEEITEHMDQPWNMFDPPIRP